MMAAQDDMTVWFAINRFYSDYFAALDRQDMHGWTGFFQPDATYRVTTFENRQQGYPLCIIRCDGLDMIRDRADAILKTVFARQRRQRRLYSGLTITPAMQQSGSEGTYSASLSFALFESVAGRPSALLCTGECNDKIV